jgi:hypothetical protein
MNQFKVVRSFDLSIINICVSDDGFFCSLDDFIDLDALSFIHPNRWESEADKNYT